ncbi:MAG: hypothetical protein PHP08_03705 [Candidatus Dojkabacteria bacterium]|nr:hypothetical protein [Candidatus Dojkabacteria bacterium]
MKISDLDFGDEDKKRSAPKDRIPMIKEVFQLVLNREPSSRELSFYKYGIQEKEEIVEKLLNDKEHKDLLEQSKQYPKVEEELKDSNHKVLQLKQEVEDNKQEIDEVRNLLNEKNKEIAILRRENSDPYNFTHSEALKYIKTLTENKRTDNEDVEENKFSTINSAEEKEDTFLDKLYKFIKSI